jgi:hypothetical protein
MFAASLYQYAAALKIYLTLAAPYAAAGAVLLALVALFLQLSLRRRLARLALGKGGSIEESIAILAREMKEAREFRVELEKYLKLAESRLRGSVSGVGLVRFNPFHGEGQGGNQSFALALIDERGMGVVFSTLYARDRVGVYAKPIEGGASTYELSEEEKAAIDKAKKQVAQNRK